MKALSLLILFVIFFYSAQIYSQTECEENIDLLIIGDSQVSATWSKSYLGNFLQECLTSNFIIYGRGGSILQSWMQNSGNDKIQTVERTPLYNHKIIGSGKKVPNCKRRIGPILETHSPAKVMFEFGDNYLTSPETFIKKDIESLIKYLDEAGISSDKCYFLTPTFEMKTKSKRNVSYKNIKNTKRVTNIIKTAIDGKCQLIDGLEVMKQSSYLEDSQFLKRVNIKEKSGCIGGAVNDNVHVCGEAARDYAAKICEILN